MQQSKAMVKCNSQVPKSNKMQRAVRCNSQMQQSDATVEYSHMQLSDATVRCNRQM